MTEVTDPSNGLKKLVLKSAQGSTAEVYLHGAHVTSWKSNSGEEQLFVSKKAVFRPPKAIRGGIPICFPQFGHLGPLEQQHGFARNSPFEVEAATSASATLVLRPSAEQLELFPHSFELRVKVTVGDDELQQELTVQNTGADPLPFTTALHTYFAITSIDKAYVAGLQGVPYIDTLKGRDVLTQQQEQVRFQQEVDCIYINTPSELKVVDEGRQEVVVIRKEALPDAIVWNPWVAKSKAMSSGDFGYDEFESMLCVEAAVAASGAVTLAPGESWAGKQTLRLAKL